MQSLNNKRYCGIDRNMSTETAVLEPVIEAQEQVTKGSSRRELNVRQKRFIVEYMKCGIGTQAARLAGYQGNNDTLAVTASDLLRHPKIKAELERTALGTKEKLEKQLAKHAFGQPLDDLTHQSQLRAIELLAKINGLLDKQQEARQLTINQLFLDVKLLDETQLVDA